jgi:hypothetical protein
MKPQGSATVYDTMAQGITSRYTHVAYSLGFVVTREAIQDNLYEKAAIRGTKKLARSFKQTKENVAANIYNRATNGSYTYGDGVALLSTAHPTLSGNQSNMLATAADMSEAALEDLVVQTMNAVDERGLRIQLMPKSLIVPTALVFEAERILKSVGQNDTANNAINALRSRGVFPEGAKVNHYLTDADAWFIRTDAPDGLKHFEREAAEFDQDNDFDTANLKFKGYERYSFGVTDFRGLYGSQGA